MKKTAIGVFDSGYGGLTILKEIVKQLPDYDYIYLGDNARAPYGPRSFDTVYQYTLQCVEWFFEKGCELVILACNTASAKALRNIQQKDLPKLGTNKRVLGVIRPSTEIIGNFSKTGSIGILGTIGTVLSESYPIEIHHFFPEIKVFQQACPMWVPLIENGAFNSPGADYFIKQYLDELLAQSAEIDTILLACTHYPILIDKIKQYLPVGIELVSQGAIVAKSLAQYLDNHQDMSQMISKTGSLHFFTTDSAADFDNHASLFFGKEVKSEHIFL